MHYSYTLLPSAEKSADAEAAWTIHVQDGFATQIGTRLERLKLGHDSWRMIFKDQTTEYDSERQMRAFIQGVLSGRCLC